MWAMHFGLSDQAARRKVRIYTVPPLGAEGELFCVAGRSGIRTIFTKTLVNYGKRGSGVGWIFTKKQKTVGKVSEIEGFVL